MVDKRTREKHKRPTPEQLDERIAIAYPDPEKVIEALMQVDPDTPVDDETAD
jgi:hypothetical protein